MIVDVFYVWNVVIPCSTMRVVVHAERLYYQEIYNFCLPVCMWMEGYRQRNYHVNMLPDIFPKGTNKWLLGGHNVSTHVRRRDEKYIVLS